MANLKRSGSNKSSKVAEEKRVKQIREFQRSDPLNRRCFDCNEMGPQYFCLDFNTFICTACSGLHRESSRRVKSISMSTFSEEEVANMVESGGNAVAQKYWRAQYNMDNLRNDTRNRDRVRRLMNQTYVDKMYLAESSSSPRQKSPRRGSSKQKQATGGKKKKSVVIDDDEWDAFGSSRTIAKSASVTEDDEFNPFADSPVKQPGGDFADFAAFEEPSKKKDDNDDDQFADFNKASDDFADFGDFEGQSKSTSGGNSNATPPAPSQDLFSLDFPSASNSTSFDAFGQGSGATSTDAFASMTAGNSNSSNTAAAAVVSDPFSNIGTEAPLPVTSPPPAAATTGDPFSAFDNMEEKPRATSFDKGGGGDDAFGSFSGLGSQAPPAAPSMMTPGNSIVGGVAPGQQTAYANRVSNYQQSGMYPTAGGGGMNHHQMMYPQQNQRPVGGGAVGQPYPAGGQQQNYPGGFQQQQHGLLASPSPNNLASSGAADPFATLNVGSEIGFKPSSSSNPPRRHSNASAATGNLQPQATAPFGSSANSGSAALAFTPQSSNATPAKASSNPFDDMF